MLSTPWEGDVILVTYTVWYIMNQEIQLLAAMRDGEGVASNKVAIGRSKLWLCFMGRGCCSDRASAVARDHMALEPILSILVAHDCHGGYFDGFLDPVSSRL